jgi:hypothetical protein
LRPLRRRRRRRHQEELALAKVKVVLVKVVLAKVVKRAQAQDQTAGGFCSRGRVDPAPKWNALRTTSARR